jgi:SAM-dependent methyltransferase
VDEVAEYNVARWRALAEARALYTRPLLDLDARSACEIVNRDERFGDLAGRSVLCLAGGGGRESAAFAVLGARVTVFDLSVEQLERDRAAAAHYRKEVMTVRGDMRDLSALRGAGFDLVWHAYSINFVPDARAVFREVARVMRPGGLYRFMCANPFVMGASTRDWDGRGYTLTQPYADGAEVTGVDEEWVYERTGGETIPPLREYRHGLGTLVGGLAAQGFRLLEASEDESMHPDAEAPPGTWDHFVSIVRPWLTFISRYEPPDDARRALL